MRGVEYVAADEVSVLRPTDLRLEARQLDFRLDRYEERLADLRSVDDLFVVTGSVHGVGHRKEVAPWVADRSAGLDWTSALEAVAQARPLPAAPRFDVVVSLLGRRNYSRYDLEDTVGAALADRLGGRFLSRSGQAQVASDVDLTVRVFVSGETALFALRLAAGPRHRRDYKQDTAPGTLHPPMAAALARLLAPSAGELVVDPFCGDGTIPVEIALSAAQVEVRGSDRDADRVHNARANAERAGVTVAVEQADAGRLAFPGGSVDLIVTNPPWNLAVEARGLLAGGLGPFWSEASRVLSPTGRLAVIMDAEYSADRILRSAGYDVALVQAVRLAGRLSQVVVGTPPGRPAWVMPPHLSMWRERARQAGLLTETGFGGGPAKR